MTASLPLRAGADNRRQGDDGCRAAQDRGNNLGFRRLHFGSLVPDSNASVLCPHLMIGDVAACVSGQMGEVIAGRHAIGGDPE